MYRVSNAYLLVNVQYRYEILVTLKSQNVCDINYKIKMNEIIMIYMQIKMVLWLKV